jgi:hypothetical protein
LQLLRQFFRFNFKAAAQSRNSSGHAQAIHIATGPEIQTQRGGDTEDEKETHKEREGMHVWRRQHKVGRHD